MKISRKETKETIHWLELIGEANKDLITRMYDIKKEANELRSILSSIIIKAEDNKNSKK